MAAHGRWNRACARWLLSPLHRLPPGLGAQHSVKGVEHGPVCTLPDRRTAASSAQLRRNESSPPSELLGGRSGATGTG